MLARRITICMYVALQLALLLLLQPAPSELSEVQKRSAPGAVLLRYSFLTGDHLIYRQTLEVTAHSLNDDDRMQEPNQSYSYFERWENHLLVSDRNEDFLQVGIQRNSLQRRLLSYRVGAEDRLESMRSRFEASDWPRVFAAGNRFSAKGSAQFPWSAIREHPSVSLVGIGEILPLPDRPISVGDRWVEPELFGFQLKAEGWETVNGFRSIRIANDEKVDSASLRFWFSPRLGAVVRVEWEADWDYEGLWIRNEKLRIDWNGRRHGSGPAAWLAQPAARMGLLASLRTSDRIPMTPAELYSLLDFGDPAVQRMALGIAYRKGMPAPPESVLSALLDSPDGRVRTLAVRMMEKLTEDVAEPMIRKASSDPDYFVRRAAAVFRPGAGIASPRETTVEASGQLDRTVEPLADSPCHADAEWPARLQRARILPPQLTGSTLRSMRTEGFRGQPYVVYVPEDYRGDEPFPLIVYLGGSGGRALEGILQIHSALARSGYIAVLPDAGGQYWWREEPAATVESLIAEVFGEFNIDANRVFLAGHSNGGTGALWLGSRLADRFAATVSLMGAGIHAEEAPIQFRFRNLSNLPTLFLHGSLDREVPVIGTIDTVKRILAENPASPIQNHLLPGRVHDLWPGTDEGRTMAHFEGLQRDPFPKRIRFQTGEDRDPRHYWIEVLDRYAPEAFVEASIEPNLIKIDTAGVRRLRLLLQRAHLSNSGPVQVYWNGRLAFEGLLSADCQKLAASLRADRDPFRAHSIELEFRWPPHAE